jgi:shikimate 5-dehydrogenase
VYHYPAIGRTTRLIGVTGFGPREVATLAILNALLAHHGVPARCLPLGVGSVPLFRKVMDAVHLGGVVVDTEHQTNFLGIATALEAAAQEAQAVDLLLPDGKSWRGYNTRGQAALDALEAGLQAGSSPVEPLQGRMVMIVGANATARAVARGIQRRGALLTIASHQRNAVQQLAQELQCRHIPFEALYTTTHDVLVVCDDERSERNAKRSAGKSGIHAAYLRPGITVMDLTGTGGTTALLREGETRGCNVIAPKQAFLRQLAAQAELLTGKETPGEALQQALKTVMVEDILFPEVSQSLPLDGGIVP